MNGTKGRGVPRGTKWAKDLLVFFKKLIEKYPTHKGRANEIVMDRCLVAVNT